MAISLEIRFVNFTTFCKPDLIIQMDFKNFLQTVCKSSEKQMEWTPELSF